jgi:hypothetical protein
VVRRTQEPRAYAACLTSLAERRLELRLERRSAHALSLGAFERRPELVRRVYSILARKQVLHPMAARVLVGVAGCSLLVASVELARCPQMVAFVPAAHTATLETQTTRGNSGFRAVDTKAILPAGHGAALLTPAASRRAVTPSSELASAPQRQLASTSEAPREVLLRAEVPDADAEAARQNASSDIAGEPQYVVLTAWEEVRTPARHPRLISDYYTDANAPPQSVDAADPSSGETVTRITVTRMIIAVYPISFGPNGSGLNGSWPGSKPAHAQDSGQPTAPLPQSGWLVFQL